MAISEMLDKWKINTSIDMLVMQYKVKHLNKASLGRMQIEYDAISNKWIKKIEQQRVLRKKEEITEQTPNITTQTTIPRLLALPSITQMRNIAYQHLCDRLDKQQKFALTKLVEIYQELKEAMAICAYDLENMLNHYKNSINNMNDEITKL